MASEWAAMYWGAFRVRFKKERDQRGLTQKEMATLLGVQDAVISHYETGFRTPSVVALCRIADALNCSMDYLMGMADWRPPR